MFLDAICNTFGGILFIAILVAVQIRYTDSSESEQDTDAPEVIAAMQIELNRIILDTESASQVLQSLQQAAVDRSDDDIKQQIEEWKKASEKLADLLAGKNDVTKQYFQNAQELAQKEQEAKNAEAKLQALGQELEKQNEVNQKLAAQIDTISRDIATLETDKRDLQSKIAQKEQQLAAKFGTENTREEQLHLPMLEDRTDGRSPIHIILRYNRLYTWHTFDASGTPSNNTADIDFSRVSPNTLGTPKRNAGIEIQDTESCKNAIRQLLGKFSPSRVYISVLVYDDSFEVFYIVRDCVIEKTFKYNLTPTTPEQVWVLGGGAAPQVQ